MRPSPIILLTLLAFACTDKGDDTGSVGGGTDADGDGFFTPSDCNDGDAYVHPGAPERCNGEDDDCDGTVDENPTDPATWYADGDGDGYGDVFETSSSCDAPAGTVANHDDCDDTNSAVNPDATEICDGEDNDCDDAVDDRDSDLDTSTASTWYADADDDGFGDASVTSLACERKVHTAATDTDCDDTDGTIYPGAAEVCGDGLVNDCDGTEEAARAVCFPAWPEDAGDIDFRFDDENASGNGGVSVSAGGDVDGDGLRDMLVGAPSESPSESYEGRAYLVLGGVTASGELSAADALFAGGLSYAGLGSSVAIAPDLNGDGLDDIILGAPGDGGDTAGATHVYYGPVSGTPASSDVTFEPEDGGSPGSSVAGLGDVDGDGVGDMLVGSPYFSDDDGYAGQVYLLLGPASSTASATFERPGASATIGWSVAGTGDTDGDGLQDMLIGGPYAASTDGETSAVGVAWLVLGESSPSGGDLDEVSTARIEGESSGGHLGATVAWAGDFDGDGLDDIVVGEPDADPVSADEGRAYVFLGGVSGAVAASAAHVILEGSESSGYAGIALGTAGDVDEDGLEDLAVGAPGAWSSGSGTGMVYLVLGGVTGTVSLDDASAAMAAEGKGDGFGAALASGDTDADGTVDLVIGAPGQDEGASDSGSIYLLLGQRPF